MKRLITVVLFLNLGSVMMAQTKPTLGKKGQKPVEEDLIYSTMADTSFIDTLPTVNFSDVPIIAFKTKEDWMQYYKYKSRIIKVTPYVKIARQLYVELQDEKENTKKRAYKRYRKDVEKEMRAKFENELKNLTVGQGEMLFKLINRETGNNAYNIIKDVKGGAAAWFYQLVGKRWGYDLKEKYNPEEEKMIELIIRELGSAYDVQ